MEEAMFSSQCRDKDFSRLLENLDVAGISFKKL